MVRCQEGKHIGQLRAHGFYHKYLMILKILKFMNGDSTRILILKNLDSNRWSLALE